MALVGGTIGLTTSATVVFAPPTRPVNDSIPLVIVNTSSGTTMYVGGASVASTGAFGIPLGASQSMALNLLGGDTLYAVAAIGAPTLAFMLGRQ